MALSSTRSTIHHPPTPSANSDLFAELRFPQVTAFEMVKALMGGAGADGYLEIRCLPSGGQWWARADDEIAVLEALRRAWQWQTQAGNADDGVYFGAAPRVREGGKADDVELCYALRADCDDDAALDKLADLVSDTIPEPSYRVESGGLTDQGRAKAHLYWLLSDPVDAAGVAAPAIKRLAAALGGDKSIHDPARVMRLPGARHRKRSDQGTGREVRVASFTRHTYTLEEVVGNLPPLEPDAFTPGEIRGEDVIPNGKRRTEILSAIGSLHRSGHGAGVLEAAALGIAEYGCDPPLTEPDDLRDIKRMVGDIAAKPNPAASREERPPWPVLDDAALYGLAGDVVRALEPLTEADPAAMLTQFLAGFGNLAGRHSYALAGGSEHPPGLYAVIVGKTSRGRKGTSWAMVRQILRSASPAWAKTCITSGAVSGEGLIWEVRDPIYRGGAIKEEALPPEDLPDELRELAEPGVADKRRLWMAAEFAGMLKAVERKDNTISAVLRQLWDDGDARTAAKNSPARTTGAHTSVIAHVTADELRRLLSETETANGFANRFLYVCAQRSKLLPESPSPDPAVIGALAERVSAAAQFAHEGHVIERDDEARELWRAEYGALTTEDLPGMLGAVTARADPQVVRLSLVYALLDRSPAVRVEHLRAALAVWRYCFDSAAWIFGTYLGDPLADRLRAALLVSPEGLTRTEIREHVGGRISGEQIDRALEMLARHGIAHAITEPTNGRSVERWSVDLVEKRSR